MAIGLLLVAIGRATHLPPFVVAGIVLVIAAVAAIIVVYVPTQPVISQFSVLKSRCERAESRLHADPMDADNTSTINKMINCDEGTLAYCAAKIASEIEQDPNWESSHLDLTRIDLWDELAGLGEGARQMAQDRAATTALELGRLRDDPAIQNAIEEDKQLRKEDLEVLAARVHAFADYRDRLHRPWAEIGPHYLAADPAMARCCVALTD